MRRSPSPATLDRLLTERLEGTPLQAFWHELLTRSGHILLLKLLADAVILGFSATLLDLGDWIFAFGIVVQAAYISQRKVDTVWGNLIGVSIYTLIDWPLDGAEFWSDLNHQVFWVFAIVVAVLRWVQQRDRPLIAQCGLVAENLARSLLVLAFYVVVSQADGQLTITRRDLWEFFWADRHAFLVWSSVGIGALLGMQAVQIATQRQTIRHTTRILRDLAAWGMGDYVVTTAIRNPDALNLQRRDRAIVFMDIRSFTRWCEVTPPDAIAAILDRYYQAVETAARQQHPLKVTFSGDEVMAIYATSEEAIAAACAMQTAAQSVLTAHNLGAGCGIHWGKTIEGLLGSDHTRTYTTIGDTVNTAKRIEGTAGARQIVVSEAVYQALNGQPPNGFRFEPRSPESVKGKTEALQLWELVTLADRSE